MLFCFKSCVYINLSVPDDTDNQLTSLRKSSSLSRSLRSRMSLCRLSSELHLRFCLTVRVRFPVSWQNLSKRDRSAHTWDRPAGGVARGLGGLQHNNQVSSITHEHQNWIREYFFNQLKYGYCHCFAPTAQSLSVFMCQPFDMTG